MVLDKIIYWLMILLPFSIAIAPAPMNVFIGFLIAAFLAKKLLRGEWFFRKETVNLPLLVLFIIICLSAINSISLKATIKGGIFRWLQYIFIFYIFAQELKDKKHLRKVVISMFLGAAMLSVDGLFQVITGRDFIRGYQPILNIGLLRATASFKDANILGIYLSAIIPLMLGLTFFYYRGLKKSSAGFLSLLALIGIVLTYSRPTLLALSVVLFFFALAGKNRGVIALLILFTLAAPFILPKSVKEWAKQVEYNPLRFMCNDDRIAVYLHSLNMIKAHPIIGVGANTFMKSYKKYKTFPEYQGIVTLDEMKAHNNFLHMAGEIGLAGLLAFFWFLWTLFRDTGRLYGRIKDDYLNIVSLSLTACLIAFLVNGLTESSLYYSALAVTFWFIAGLSLGVKRLTGF